MSTIIIVFILIVIVTFALRSSFSHFKGEGGCCGGSTPKRRWIKKRLKGKWKEKYLIHLEGMHCKACAAKIQEAINEVDGVVADVNFQKSLAKIETNHRMEPSDLIEIIELQGYQVVQIQKV